MWAIFKKELWTGFGNRSAWLIIALFSVVCALFLFFFENDLNILDIGQASLQSYFTLVPWLLVFVMPALTMRTIAEERQSGTLTWLFAQPVKVSEIILGKFFAACLVGLLCLVPSLVYLSTVYLLGVPKGNLDFGMTFGSYFGMALITGAFAAIGILASSIAKNQIVAFLVGIFLCFIMFFGIEQLAGYKLLGAADYYLQNLGFYAHFTGFARGLADSRDIFYFLLMIFVCLCLSVFFVKKKK